MENTLAWKLSPRWRHRSSKSPGTGALPTSLDKVHVKYGTRETTLRSTKIEYSMNLAICINSAFPQELTSEISNLQNNSITLYCTSESYFIKKMYIYRTLNDGFCHEEPTKQKFVIVLKLQFFFLRKRKKEERSKNKLQLGIQKTFSTKIQVFIHHA